VSTYVSEEHIDSIIRVEEISSARNQQASRPISQKKILFITTAMITSNPIKLTS
jgi:hypothetical protein